MAHGKQNTKKVRDYDYDRPHGHKHPAARRSNRSAQKAALKRYCY